MRYLFLCLTFLICCHLNSSNSDSLKINLLEIKIDSLINQQKSFKTSQLEDRIIQATETISNQNAIISSFGALYSIITIVLALIGIALPILTYQFGIKPSQKALKEFEENSEKKFNNFLAVNKRKEIDSAFSDLQSTDLSIRTNALTFLSLKGQWDISRKQINDLIELIEKNEADTNFINQLLHILSNQKKEEIKAYFSTAILKPQQNKMTNLNYYSLKALSYYGYQDYNETLRKYLGTAEHNYLTIASTIASVARYDLVIFFNDRAIIDCLTELDLTEVKNSYKSYLHGWNFPTSDFQETYIYKKISTLSNPDPI